MFRPTTLTYGYILTGYDGRTATFPSFRLTYKFYDTSAGRSTTARYGFSLAGCGMSDERYAYNENANNKEMINCVADQSYSSCFVYDGTITAPVNNTYPANIFMSLNGEKKDINYFFSYATTTLDLYRPSETYPCYGAYGKPVSNGIGGRHADLGYDGAFDKTSTEWKNAAQGGGTDNRPYDYGYNLVPSSSGILRNRVNSRSSAINGGQMVSLCIGHNLASTTNSFNGDIAEVIVYNRKLTDEETKAVNNYIYYRYNIGSEQ